MGNDYNNYVKMYADHFDYTKVDDTDGKTRYVKATSDSLVCVEHIDSDKYVKIRSSDKLKEFKAGDLLLCVIEGLELGV